MRSWKPPTNEQIEHALSLLQQKEQTRYFFSRLENPLWLAPLRNRGFFTDPPARRRKGEFIVEAPWPEAQYLQRIAAEVPDQVLEVILNLDEVDNERVRQSLLDTISELPDSMLVMLTPTVRTWVTSEWQPLTGDRLIAYIGRLTEAGYEDDAFSVAQRTLTKKLSHDSWRYAHILEQILPGLESLNSIRTVSLLVDLLEQAIRQSKWVYVDHEGICHSETLRTSIGEHEQDRHRDDPANALIDAVRDVSDRAIRGNPESGIAVLDLLESYELDITTRLAMYLAATHRRISHERVSHLLSVESPLQNSSLHYELYHLLEQRFADLPSESQRRLLIEIDRGPTYAQVQAPSDAVRESARRWCLRWLHAIRQALSEEYHAIYLSLIDEFGEPKDPDLLISSSGIMRGDASPKPSNDLAAMSDGDLLLYVRNWTPQGGVFDPSPLGLARALEEVARVDPNRFVRLAPEFSHDVNPLYIRHILYGLRSALKQGAELDWGAILALMSWIANQPRGEVYMRFDSGDLDTNWGACRQEICHVLVTGFKIDCSNGIPFVLAEIAWRVIDEIAGDPEPSPEYEDRYGGDNMDPLTLSINTVRGMAITAAMAYIIWAARNTASPKGSPSPAKSILSIQPATAALLARHLDVGHESSVAVRAVYGRFFPVLLSLDEAWALSMLHDVFPADDAFAALRVAAWNTYVTTNGVYGNVVDALWGEYSAAVDRLLDDEQAHPRHLSPEEKLAEHIMVIHWQGIAAPTGDHSLTERFFEAASPRIRAHAISFVGRSLAATAKPIPEKIVSRLQDLWTQRVESAEIAGTSDSSDEVKEFGSWFACQAFDDTWAVAQLERTLKISGGRIAPEYLVAKGLQRAAMTHPHEAVRCLRHILYSEEPILAFEWAEAIRMVLHSAITGDHLEARRLAEETVNELGSRGVHDYRDLLRIPDDLK